MTLSRFFRDYLYIPLGGNRVSEVKMYRNLLIVFLATGIWHGAAWNFIIWGLWHGLFLVIERSCLKYNFQFPKIIKHIYLLLIVMVGWVFFRSDTLMEAIDFLKIMFGFSGFEAGTFQMFFHILNLTVIICGIIFTMPIYSKIKSIIPSFIMGIIISLGMIVATILILNGSYSPFLYFRF